MPETIKCDDLITVFSEITYSIVSNVDDSLVSLSEILIIINE